MKIYTASPYKNIMIVNNNKLENLYFLSVIEHCGFAENCQLYQHSKEALHYLIMQVNHETLLPDLIFLNLGMPGLQDIHFLNEIEKLPAKVIHHCPVVMMTSDAEMLNIQRTIGFPSIRCYIEKPLDVPTLLSIRHQSQQVKTG